MEMQKIKKYAAVGALALLGVGVASTCVDPLWAASTTPDAVPSLSEPFKDFAKQANEQGWRAGRGMSICPIKLAILMIIYLAWVATTSWCNNDAEALGDPDRGKWNGTNIIAFAATFLVALFIPIFWIGLPLVIVAWLVPIFTYIKARNKELLDADKVMTAGHLSFWFKTKVLKQKVKPKKMAYEGGSTIQLEAVGAGLDEKTLLGRTVNSRNFNGSVGYNYFRELLYHAIHARATDVVIEFGVEETKFQYQIDGVYHYVTDAFKKPWLREEADDVAAAAKILIGANPQNRSARQQGVFKMLYDKNKKGKPLTCEVKLETAGTKTGEIFKVTFVFAAASFSSLEQLGVSEERQAQMKSLINADKGLVVLATAPHHGLKTLTTVIFGTADRFTRDFAGVEDEQHPYQEIENISITKYDSAKGETPMTVLPDVFFREPKVLLIRDMVNLETWKLCCEEVNNDRLIITTVRGNDAVSTIIALLQQGVDPELLASTLTAVITQRLVRRLCNECKEEVEAPPQVVKALGLDPAKPVWFRQHTHEPVPEGERDYYVPCEYCRDIGYYGRIAVFDVLEINDEMRQIIAADATLAQKDAALRKRALASGQEGYWVDGKRLIKEGVTSYDEMRRSLAFTAKKTNGAAK